MTDLERRVWEAEVIRLRAALTEIAELYSGGHGYRAKEIALRALNQQLRTTDA